MEYGEEISEKKEWWEYFAFLWLGPYAFVKGKQWYEENKMQVIAGMIWLTILLILIVMILYARKK